MLVAGIYLKIYPPMSILCLTLPLFDSALQYEMRSKHCKSNPISIPETPAEALSLRLTSISFIYFPCWPRNLGAVALNSDMLSSCHSDFSLLISCKEMLDN